MSRPGYQQARSPTAGTKPGAKPVLQTKLSKADIQRIVVRSRFDPVWFAENILRLSRQPGEPSLDDDPDNSWELDEWQRELFEVVADVARKAYGKPTKLNHAGKQLITVRACQGPGKTFGLAALVHWFGFCFHRAVIPCTAPKASQVTNRLFKEFARIRNRAIPGYADLTFMTGGHINWGNDRTWFATAETGQQPDNLQGFHGRYIMFVVDEASGVAEGNFPVVRGAISTGKVALAVYIGNPTKTMGGFADSHRRRETDADHYRVHIPYTKSKRVKRSWVEAMIRSYGADSPAVKVRVFGDFPDMEAGQLISLSWVADARMRSTEADGSLPVRRISVDVADGGVDESVITLATHYASKTVIDRQFAYSFPPAVSPVMCAEEVIRLWEAYGMDADRGDDIVVDSLGVGAGTTGILIRRGLPVIRYAGGSSASNPERFRNLRVQTYIALRDAFRDGTIAWAEDMAEPQFLNELESQLCSVKLNPNSNRVDDLMSKQDMLRAGLKSPDRADSLAMQFVTAATPYAKGDTGESIIVVPSEAWSRY